MDSQSDVIRRIRADAASENRASFHRRSVQAQVDDIRSLVLKLEEVRTRVVDGVDGDGQ